MSKQRAALELALDALDCIYSPLHVREINKVGAAMAAIREALAEPEQKLDSALEALQNEMREIISKLDPKEMVWIHQPPGMPPILCKEPVVGAVPVCATASARKPVGTVTGWYGGHTVIEPIDGWIPAVGTVLYSAPPARKPLTDEEIKKAMTEFENDIEPSHVFWRKIARAIERAHGITQPTEENT